MPLSTIERPRAGLGSATLVGVSGPGAAMGAGPSQSIYSRRNIHTPPQTPPYHGTLNGTSAHVLHGAPGMGQTMLGAVPHSHSPYGHLGTAQRSTHHNHAVGTLGRNMNGHHNHLNPPQ